MKPFRPNPCAVAADPCGQVLPDADEFGRPYTEVTFVVATKDAPGVISRLTDSRLAEDNLKNKVGGFFEIFQLFEPARSGLFWNGPKRAARRARRPRPARARGRGRGGRGKAWRRFGSGAPGVNHSRVPSRW